MFEGKTDLVEEWYGTEYSVNKIPPKYIEVYLVCDELDLIHDTCHLCTRLRTDGRKVMSRGFSEGKQVMKFDSPRFRGRVCLF